MKKYDYFDYKKVLAVLKHLQGDVSREKNSLHILQVYNFEEDLICADPFGNLFRTTDEENPFQNSKCFNLIQAYFEIDGEILFGFRMGEQHCEISCDFQLDDPKVEPFKNVFTQINTPEESWEITLADFIKKVKSIVKQKLVFKEE